MKLIVSMAKVAVAGIQKKIYGSEITTLIILNKEMNDRTKIVQTLKGYNILLNGITKTIENETKERKGRLLGIETLGVSSLGDMLSGKGILIVGYGNK